jgi:hypothetical protein
VTAVAAFWFIVVMLVAVFAFDIGRRWWRENEWRRHWRRTETDDD